MAGFDKPLVRKKDPSCARRLSGFRCSRRDSDFAGQVQSRSHRAAEDDERRPENHKEAFVVEHGYENQRLQSESYAEFLYQPDACDQRYRMVAVRKDIEVTKVNSSYSTSSGTSFTSRTNRLKKFPVAK
ncbi:MAG: hypothetical protein AAGD07_20205, partial [Planctomycetota bacterium]